MKRRAVYLTTVAVLLGVVLTGCGSSKETGNHAEVSGTEISQTVEVEQQTEQEQASETIEVVEDATMTEEEDGSLIVETDTGEQVVIDGNADVTEHEDGSKTYETEDGTKVNVDSDGQTTVTTEEKVPADSQTPSASETEEAHTHSYTASITTEATCTANGVKTFTCACGNSYTKDIDKTSHVAANWTTTKEATCTADGAKVKNCTVCGTNMETGTITKLGHKEGNWEVTKTATCKEEGAKVVKCTNCGTQLKSESIAKAGHTSGDWIVTKEATCNTNGSKHKVCSICGVETAVEAIAANGTHSYSWSTNGDTRTMKCACGATGITEYKYGNVWGYFDDAAAEELWGLINTLRNNTWVGLRDPMGNNIGSTYVSSLNKNNDLFAKAKKRAPEVALSFGHNGEQHECLAAGMATAGEAKDEWVASDTHCSALTNPDYTIGGVACFWYDSAGDGNCYPIWVFELGY